MHQTIKKVTELWGGNCVDFPQDIGGKFSTVDGLQYQLDHLHEGQTSIFVAFKVDTETMEIKPITIS
jgi:hypothetical protein